jgi:hypothetical protein
MADPHGRGRPTPSWPTPYHHGQPGAVTASQPRHGRPTPSCRAPGSGRSPARGQAPALHPRLTFVTPAKSPIRRARRRRCRYRPTEPIIQTVDPTLARSARRCVKFPDTLSRYRERGAQRSPAPPIRRGFRAARISVRLRIIPGARRNPCGQMRESRNHHGNTKRPIRKVQYAT